MKLATGDEEGQFSTSKETHDRGPIFHNKTHDWGQGPGGQISPHLQSNSRRGGGKFSGPSYHLHWIGNLPKFCQVLNY